MFKEGVFVIPGHDKETFLIVKMLWPELLLNRKAQNEVKHCD